LLSKWCDFGRNSIRKIGPKTQSHYPENSGFGRTREREWGVTSGTLPRDQENAMRIYNIGNDRISLCHEPPPTVNKGEIVVASKQELHAASLSGKRLLALWNSLSGVEKRQKVGDRAGLIEELWSAMQLLPDPDTPPNVKGSSKQDELLATMRRPQGVTVDRLVAPHRTRRSLGNPQQEARAHLRNGGARSGLPYRRIPRMARQDPGGILVREQLEEVGAAPLASAAAVLALIEKLALDPGADVAKLERLIAMYERLKVKEAELAFNAAKGRILNKLALVRIVKNRSVACEIEDGNPQGGSYKAFKYAPLEEIDKHLRPLLVEEEMDLSYSDQPEAGDGILIRGRLKHLPSGHFEDSFMPAPPDTSGGKSIVQGVGSTNSYLRRYIACNIFNIVVAGDDDDGTGGTLDEVQTQTIVDLVKKAKVGPKFLKYMRAQSIDEVGSLKTAVATIAARDYRKAVSTLEEQIAKAEAGRADLS
jgi:hypothetical protein